MVSGSIYSISYDGTQFQVITPVTTAFQASDATLTALAALSWSSGSPVVQFTAADTVSLTLTPSVTSVTAYNATGANTPAATFCNTTDNASVRALRIEGDRATPTDFDQVYASWFLSDSAGNQDEMFRFSAQGTTLTSPTETARALLSLRIAGSLTSLFFFNSNSITPATNDLLALGSTTLGFSDLHLATGGVLNWANGLVTLTHDATSDGLEVAGGSFRARIALSTETSGTLTAASANKRVKATAGVTINDGVFTAEDSVEIYNDSDVSITITQDTGMTLRLAGSTSTGNRTLAARGIAYVYFDTNADAAVAGSGVS
jgi:hypothetical protein